jgi:hypothetical protein
MWMIEAEGLSLQAIPALPDLSRQGVGREKQLEKLAEKFSTRARA